MAKALIFARQYSSATSSKLVKPPIALFGLAGQYTNALYSAASKTSKLPAVESDLQKLSEALDKDTKFRDYVFDPLVNANAKSKALTEALTSKLKLSDLTVNMVAAMAENRRLSQLPAVAKNFSKVMAHTRGELEVTVYTAKPVTDPAQLKAVEAALKGFTSKKLTIKMKVDPSIVGGLVVDFDGEHYVDMSIRSKLKMYTDLIKMSV